MSVSTVRQSLIIGTIGKIKTQLSDIPRQVLAPVENVVRKATKCRNQSCVFFVFKIGSFSYQSLVMSSRSYCQTLMQRICPTLKTLQSTFSLFTSYLLIIALIQDKPGGGAQLWFAVQSLFPFPETLHWIVLNGSLLSRLSVSAATWRDGGVHVMHV